MYIYGNAEELRMMNYECRMAGTPVVLSAAEDLLRHHRTPLYGVRLIHRIPRTPNAHKFAPGNPGRGPLSGSQS